MLKSFFRATRMFIFQRRAPAFLAGLLFLAASPLWAQMADFQPTLTVGAGIQTSYDHAQPDGGKAVDTFGLDHLRLYFSGDITKYLSAMVNTDYIANTNGINGNSLQVLDAVGQFHMSPMINIWFGRFLPPSDRANLYGPFYANEYKVYTDGIQDGYPFIFQGRDNGAMYWGDFKAGSVKIKASAGAFDGASATASNDVIFATRVQLDFWDPENGYYLNGTYYGDKNLLAIGGATEVQDNKTAATFDFLLERKIMNGGAFTIESEYARYDGVGGYPCNCKKSQGGYGLASVLFPKQIGMGKIQATGKFAEAEFTGIGPLTRQKTTEVNLNYIIKQFDARIMAYGKNTTFTGGQKEFWDAGVGLQFQLSKQILGPK